MRCLVQADSGLDALIWIILALFWGLGQILARKRPPRGGVRPPAAPAPGQPPLQQQIERFYELVTGETLPREPEAPPPQPVPRRPVAPRVVVHTRRQPAYPAAARQVASPGAPPHAPPPPVEPAAPASAEPVPAPEVVLRTIRRRQIIAMPGLKNIHFKLVHMQLTQRRSPAGARRPALRSHAALREALLHRIVLGPPVGG